MNTRIITQSLGWMVGAMVLLSCGGEQKRASAPPTDTPAIKTGTFHRAGGLAVSDDLVKACRLHFEDTASAPKFDFDKSEVHEADRPVLAKVAECLTTGPLKGKGLRLVGHTDNRGEDQYNMALGAHRASGVAEYLATLGLERGRVDLTSRGELDAIGVDETGMQTDRRVDVMLAQ